MLYILLNRKKQAPWQIDYERLYQEYLTVPYQVLEDRSNLAELNEKDYLWIQHFSDIDTLEVRACKARKMAQVNGTAVNPYIGAVDKQQEEIEYNEILDIGLVFDKEMAQAMKEVYPKVDFWAVGFPIPEISLPKVEKRKQICIAGRLDAFKNVNINLWLTNELRSRGYQVIFCFPDKDSQEQKLDFYKPEKFPNVEFRRCNQQEWYQIANESEFYLLTSFDDTSSVSLWEAYYLGCYILVPDIADGIVRYPDYVTTKFHAFDRETLEYLIEKKPKQIVDTKNIIPQECVERLEEYLSEKGI